ncbi:hypothetical protein ABEB36_010657 [Hypothenemus hampei]|uniref:Pseudouridine synthase RsuA/RluA-like domain-containing protein n=1 Tax=Hypothenemus hampei TaxID=57062 RepID=A0ABD1ECS3_HYPHA
MIFTILFLFSRIVSKLFYRTKVLLSNEDLIILDKEPDFKINSNKIGEQTVQTFLKLNFPWLASEKLFHEFYFAHRLDYATSGILCIPKNKECCKVLSEAFSNKTTKKYYTALVRGLFSQLIVDVNIPIGNDKRETEIQKMCTLNEKAFCEKYRTAQTVITLLEEGTFNAYPATKILCRPITGRRHQIRVHCHYLGHTIIGDYTYSNKKDFTSSRMYLHAIRLILPESLGNIDISTSDPLTKVPQWKKITTIQSFAKAYSTIDNYIMMTR